jgi:hypothetical protein
VMSFEFECLREFVFKFETNLRYDPSRFSDEKNRISGDCLCKDVYVGSVILFFYPGTILYSNWHKTLEQA